MTPTTRLDPLGEKSAKQNDLVDWFTFGRHATVSEERTWYKRCTPWFPKDPERESEHHHVEMSSVTIPNLLYTCSSLLQWQYAFLVGPWLLELYNTLVRPKSRSEMIVD